MKYIRLFLILIANNVCLSQVDHKITEDYIDNMIQNITENKSLNQVEHKKFVKDLEQKVIASKDTTLILKLYFKLIYTNINNYDKYTAEKYDQKAAEILKKYKDNRQLGLYYHYHTYLNHWHTSLNERIKGYLKAAELLEHYGNDKDLILTYYSLAALYIDAKDYKKSIKYSLRAKNILTTNKILKKNIIYYDFYLFLNYTRLNNKDSLVFYRNKIQSANINDIKIRNFFVRYFCNDLVYLIKTKKDNDAIKSAFKIDSIIRANYFEDKKHILDANAINTYYKVKEIDHLKTLSKNKNLENQKKIAFLVIAIFLVIIIFLILYIKSRLKINQRLKEALDSKNIFIDTLTHEIKTPINSIQSISFLISQNQNIASNSEFINTLNFSTNYLINILNNFVQHSSFRKKNSDNIIKDNKVDLEILTKSIVNSLQIENKNNNTINLYFDDNIDFLVILDEVKFSQVLMNLLSNSVKFTKEGIVDFYVKCIEKDMQTANIYFEIKDNGIGVSEDKLKTIFEPFMQESKEVSKKYGGLGLGLSIVKKTIELFGSNINIESKKGSGTKIFFTLALSIEKKESLISNQKNNIVVLLVEDNKINQALTKRIINNKGYLCDVANDGQEAVEMFKSSEYDIVLMDIMMPVMDGYEASMIIKNISPETPIIALSSISKELNAKKIKESKFNMFLNKPTSPTTIYETIENFVVKC